MAKRKKSMGVETAMPMQSSSGGMMHLGIDSAENGMIVRIDGEHQGKYFEKKFVATSPRQAFRIAAAHMPMMGKKAGGKKKGRKGKALVSKKA